MLIKPKKYGRLTPFMMARMAVLRSRGKSRSEIAQYFQNRRTYKKVNSDTIRTYISKHFKGINEKNWKDLYYHWLSQATLTAEQKSEIAKTRDLVMSAQKRRARASKGLAAIASFSPAQYRARSLKRQATLRKKRPAKRNPSGK